MRRDALECFLGGGAAAVDPALRPLAGLTPRELEELPGLPYTEPHFARRMVALQLDQSTDQASRRQAVVSAQVAGLARRVPLAGVLHPLCGPGVVARALRDAGTRQYLGVDVNRHAVHSARRLTAWPEGFRFVAADALARPAPWGRRGPFDLALLTYESLNAFPPAAARHLAAGLGDGLAPRALLAAEVRLAQPRGQQWRSAWEHRPGGSLFERRPHLLLRERAPGAGGAAVVDRFVVVPDDPEGLPVAYHSTVWLYPRPRLEALLAAAGWELLELLPPAALDTDNAAAAAGVFAVARRA